jgi:hypothetical protein
MLKCCWAILCEKTIFNQETGQLSLIDILPRHTQIELAPENSENSFLSIDFVLVTYWERESVTDGINIDKYRITITEPLQNQSIQAEFPLLLDADSLAHFGRVNFPGLPIFTEGYYRFIIEIPDETNKNWIEVNSVTLNITLSTEVEQELGILDDESPEQSN